MFAFHGEVRVVAARGEEHADVTVHVHGTSLAGGKLHMQGVAHCTRLPVRRYVAQSHERAVPRRHVAQVVFHHKHAH